MDGTRLALTESWGSGGSLYDHSLIIYHKEVVMLMVLLRMQRWSEKELSDVSCPYADGCSEGKLGKLVDPARQWRY